MALAFRVGDPDEIGSLFAAYDEYSSILNNLFGRVLTPDDDYYTAPWCFMPDSEYGGFIVMTTRVPWLHGHGHMPRSSYRTSKPLCYRQQHFQHAQEIMKRNGTDDFPYVVSSAEQMQESFSLDEDELYTFTNDGGFPDKEDISSELEDWAVRVTCEAMGWDVPTDWREERRRERMSRYVMEGQVFDLADLDANKQLKGNKRMKYSTDYPNNNENEEGDIIDNTEEKKDAFHDRGCNVEHERDGQQQQQQQQQQYSNLVSSQSGEHEENKRESLLRRGDQRHHSLGYEGYAASPERRRHVDSLFYDDGDNSDDDTDIMDDEYEDDGEYYQSYQGCENVEQQQPQQQPQHIDSFYDNDANGAIEEGEERPDLIEI